jgi:hypothetical protein
MRKAFVSLTLLLFLVATVFVITNDSIGGLKKKGDKGQRFAKPMTITRPKWTPNRIADYITNNGQLVSNIPTSSAGMEWPAGSNNTINYASGLWVAGKKNGEIVASAGEYVVEFQPGPILPSGLAADPNSPNYRIYTVNQSDFADPSQNPDFAAWPYGDGAPSAFDATGAKVPGLLGTSMTWCVFNDLDEVLHSRLFSTKPMGIEVQQTAWAFNRPDAFGDMLFFKFVFINKGGVDITDTYVSFWADIDIGDAADLVGCDTTISLGYMYKTQADGLYGDAAPAIGYDFFQGPIVPSPGDVANVSGRKIPDYKNLPMSSFAKYINGGPSQYSDPAVGSEAYSFMLGMDRAGNPIINPQTGQVTKFWHTGDPVTGTGWLDDVHGDKRFLMSSGPFTLAAGDTQEVVGGIVIAQGSDGPSTVQKLKQADQSAQAAYDNNFDLPKSPQAPTVEVIADSGSLLLKWDARAESYNEIDNFHVDANGDPTYYTFQGYNVYQTDELTLGTSSTVKKLATFDMIDGVKDVRDIVDVPGLGQQAELVVQTGKDNGVKRFLRITQDAIRGNSAFVPYRRYYFVVTAYGYNELGSPHALESTLKPILAIPQPQPLGNALTTPSGDTLTAIHTGASDGSITPIVVDPAALTGHEYEVRFRNTANGTVYDVWDVTTNTRKDSNRTNQSDATGPFDYPIVDGVLISVTGAPNDFSDFLTVANANGPLDPPEYGAFAFNSSGFPHPTTADRPDGARQQATAGIPAGAAGWGIHTADNGTRASYSAFISRVTNNETRWPQIIPYDWEIRFTATGGYAYDPFVTAKVFKVPFELWRIGIGTPNDPSDDVRMVPYVLDDVDGTTNLGDGFNLPATHPQAGANEHTISGGDNDPYSDWIYWATPTNDAPGDAGYKAWEAAALAIPGGEDDGSFYNVMAADNTMRRMVLVFWNGGSISDPTYPANLYEPLPETGTVFRILTTKPNTPFDTFRYNTNAPIKANAALAKADVKRVNVFPNPYIGYNIEERDPVNRFVTFTHLTPTAKIRIFTLAGELVKTIEHSDGTQLERWDLRNASAVPVASGIYIAHIELPSVGQKILKVAIFQPEERLDVF